MKSCIPYAFGVRCYVNKITIKPLNVQTLFKDLFNARFILASNRLAWIDYARGFCIILVCYRHCFEGLKEAHLAVTDFHVLQVLNVCFYSFRMPLFFIVSGLFVTRGLMKKGLSDYVSGRFKIVFYPLIIWGSLQITIQLVLKNYVNAKPVPFDYINLIINPRNPTNNQQFWYLNALFFVGAFYAFFKVVLRLKIWHQVLLGLVAFYVAGYMNIHGLTFYIFTDVFRYYIYFCIGDIISAYIFQDRASAVILSPKWLISSGIVCIALQTLFTVINLQHHDDDYVISHMNWAYFIISLSGCAFMIQLAHIMQKKGYVKWLRVIGYHSLYIYLMHLMLIAATRIILMRIFHITYVPLIMFIAISIGVTVPIILYNLSTRIGAWWLFSLKKPNAEIEHYNNKPSVRTV